MKKSLNYANLKAIALITMFIDHLGFRFISEFVRHGVFPFADRGALIYYIFRFIGRTAFILFAFILTESFRNTSSRSGYALRLVVAAVMSEIPFDLFSSGTGNMLEQNVIFTLLLGYLTLLGIDRILVKYRAHSEEAEVSDTGNVHTARKVGTVILVSLTILAGMLAAELIRAEYGCMGIALIVAFYFLKEKKAALAVAVGLIYCSGFIVTSVIENYLNIMSAIKLNGIIHYSFGFSDAVAMALESPAVIAVWTVGALAGLIPVFLYNGKKGYPLSRIFYYLFYPLHMILMYAIYIFMLILMNWI